MPHVSVFTVLEDGFKKRVEKNVTPRDSNESVAAIRSQSRSLMRLPDYYC